MSAGSSHVAGVVLRRELVAADDEALHGQPLRDDMEDVLDAVPLLGGRVVLADRAARDDAAEVLHHLQHGLERLAAHLDTTRGDE